MKFASLFAIFAFAQVSEASDIACTRNQSGVQCFDQTSLLEIVGDNTILSGCNIDESKLNERFNELDSDRNGYVTWYEYYSFT